MHLQIVEVNRQLTRRYVANAPDQSRRMGGTARAAGMLRGQYSGLGAIPLPSNWIDGRRVRAAEKAPQRKRPCRSRATARRSLIRHAFLLAQPFTARINRTHPGVTYDG